MKLLLALIILLVIIGAVFYFWLEKENSIQTPEEQLFDITLPADFDEYQIQRFNEQLEILKQMYAQDPADAEFWIGLGNLCQIVGDYQKAVQSYIKAGQIAPFNTISFANLARVYETYIKDYVQAEEYYQQAIKNNPRDAWLFIDCSKLYRNKFNNLEKEEEILLKGIQLNPENPDILLFLSNFYKRNNNIKEAIKYLERAIEVSPQNNLYREELEELKKKL